MYRNILPDMATGRTSLFDSSGLPGAVVPKKMNSKQFLHVATETIYNPLDTYK